MRTELGACRVVARERLNYKGSNVLPTSTPKLQLPTRCRAGSLPADATWQPLPASEATNLRQVLGALSNGILRIGQSADPDDAYMSWALASGRIGVDGHRVEIEFTDIETLNRWALEARLDLTALSAAAYPKVADSYQLLRCGASFGDGYGPIVVGRESPDVVGPEQLRGLRIGVPGELTTAFLLLRIYASESFAPVPMAFDRILDAVIAREIDAGLIIHEGQLVYRRHGLHALFEPARAWDDAERLPLPLGVVAVRRDLGATICRQLADRFLASIRLAQEQPRAAMAFAASHSRGIDPQTLREFVDRYVDGSTLDMGTPGERALETLCQRAQQAGVLTTIPRIDLL